MDVSCWQWIQWDTKAISVCCTPYQQPFLLIFTIFETKETVPDLEESAKPSPALYRVGRATVKLTKRLIPMTCSCWNAQQTFGSWAPQRVILHETLSRDRTISQKEYVVRHRAANLWSRTPPISGVFQAARTRSARQVQKTRKKGILR